VTAYGFMMGLSPREPIGRFADLAAEAEALGFEMAWLADSQLYTKNVFVALTLAAERTRAISFGPGVTNPVTRHFTVLANAMGALQEIGGDRAVLGIGSGDAAVLPLGMRPANLALLREAIVGIRSIATQSTVQTPAGPLNVKAGGRPFPILLAASQPGMLRLAGELADGIVLMGAADPGLTAWQLERVAEGAAAAGRSLADLHVDLWFSISMLDDPAQAIRDVRPWATSQARLFRHWKELPPSLEPWHDQFEIAHRAHSFQRHLERSEESQEAVSDDFVRWVGVAGNAEECAAKIAPLLRLKVDRLTFALLPGGRRERLQRYAAELFERVDALSASAP
jgi:5,10-methylenetetrahydromethanopterin reductase